MVMIKRANKRLISILSPTAIIMAIVNLALIVFIVCMIIGFNYQYQIHRPSYLHQINNQFKAKDGTVYFSQSTSTLRYYSSESKLGYSDVSFFHANKRLNWLGHKSLCIGDSYFAFCGSLRTNDSDEFPYLQIYDYEFNLIKEIENENFYDAAFFGNRLYYISKEGLMKYDIDSDELYLVSSEVLSNFSYYDDDFIVHIGNQLTILDKTLRGKILLSILFDNSVKHLCSSAIDLYFEHDSIYINGVQYQLNGLNVFINKLYDNAYIIDDYLIFAGFKYLSNKNCGALNDNSHICICRLEKSYLFSYDLLNKNFIAIKEYDSGTFLIDYDFKGAKYYRNGELYIDDVLYKKCPEIVPGELEKVKGKNYFSNGDEKANYYLSYLDGHFYGI